PVRGAQAGSGGLTPVVERARRLLTRPGAWIEASGPAYLVRLGADRRMRVNLTLDEAAFRALIADPGLSGRPGGGWVARRGKAQDQGPAPGRPGFVEGERAVMQPDGRMGVMRANVGESPIAWLARRRDQSGRPWLTPAEIIAGERLRRDAETASTGASVTMRWDAL